MIYNYYLGLGSNIEPRLEYLRNSIHKLKNCGKILKKSSLYETSAWGNVKQPDFLNAVIYYQSNKEPFELIKELKYIESETGRTENKIKWGPREIDIDILFVDDIQMANDKLEIPHKYFKERNFVLVPMAEINPEYMITGSKFNIEYYIKNCKDNSIVKKIKSIW